MMTKQNAIILLLVFAVHANGLVCWHCDATSERECSRSGQFFQCTEDASKVVCATEIRRNYGQLQVLKLCKQREACLLQQNENWITSINGPRCNDGDEVSLCRCCCYGSYCNKDESCLPTRRRRCRRIPTTFIHGDPAEVTCSNGNRVGSTCRFKCDGDKVVTLSFSEDITCLPSGKWNRPIPNCAGPCPPNVYVDMVVCVHRNTEDQALALIRQGSTHFFRTYNVGGDGARLSRFHYDSRVHFPHLTFEDTINQTESELLNLIFNISYHPDTNDNNPPTTIGNFKRSGPGSVVQSLYKYAKLPGLSFPRDLPTKILLQLPFLHLCFSINTFSSFELGYKTDLHQPSLHPINGRFNKL